MDWSYRCLRKSQIIQRTGLPLPQAHQQQLAKSVSHTHLSSKGKKKKKFEILADSFPLSIILCSSYIGIIIFKTLLARSLCKLWSLFCVKNQNFDLEYEIQCDRAISTVK